MYAIEIEKVSAGRRRSQELNLDGLGILGTGQAGTAELERKIDWDWRLEIGKTQWPSRKMLVLVLVR